jgi:hypothetical protein
MAAEEMRRMEQRTSNYSRWQMGNNDVDNNDKKQQSTNVQRQRRRMMTARERWGTGMVQANVQHEVTLITLS